LNILRQCVYPTLLYTYLSVSLAQDRRLVLVTSCLGHMNV